MLAASSGKRNVTHLAPVSLQRTLNMTHQGAARDAASAYFRWNITKTDILVLFVEL